MLAPSWGGAAPLRWFDGDRPRTLEPLPGPLRAPGTAFRPRHGRQWLEFSHRLVVIFRQPRSITQARTWGEHQGLTLLEGRNDRAFVFQCEEARSCIEQATDLYRLPETRYAYPDFRRQRPLRSAPFVPNDPLFSDQWHLSNPDHPPNDARLLPAWLLATGDGVNLAIVDDGLDLDHQDLAAQVVTSLNWDFVDDDPEPAIGYHGTRAAGVAAAVGGNHLGVTGTAPEAGLVALQLDGNYSDTTEAAALSHARDRIAIYSNSWGPIDGGAELDGPGPLTQAALENGARAGRGGLGNLFVWAGGNGGRQDNANYDGYANSRYTLSVTAFTNLGTLPWYAEPCACHLVAAPSSGGTSSLVTTNPWDDYISSFGGTSASTPLVAGVVALMLEANPDLSWRDVQLILASSADPTDLEADDWVQNGAGHLVSHLFGFGRVNAGAAVETALDWPLVGTEVTLSKEAEPMTPIPDDNPQGVSFTLTIDEPLRVESVEVEVDAGDHPHWGDLAFTLVSPQGTQSILSETHANGDGPGYDPWRFTSLRHLDEQALGTWTLQVSDGLAGNQGTLRRWRLSIHGTRPEVCAERPQIQLIRELDHQSLWCRADEEIQAQVSLLRWSELHLQAPEVRLAPGTRITKGSRLQVAFPN